MARLAPLQTGPSRADLPEGQRSEVRSKTRERSEWEREAMTNLKVTSPQPTRGAGRGARNPAAPIGRSGLPKHCPDRQRRNDSNSTGANGPATLITATHRTVNRPDLSYQESRPLRHSAAILHVSRPGFRSCPP